METLCDKKKVPHQIPVEKIREYYKTLVVSYSITGLLLILTFIISVASCVLLAFDPTVTASMLAALGVVVVAILSVFTHQRLSTQRRIVGIENFYNFYEVRHTARREVTPKWLRWIHPSVDSFLD